jgi:flagellar hook-associated protein 3 FlgL
MKTTFVSSAAVSQALRQSTLKLQSELVKAQTEAATGRAQDVGLKLGARTGQSVSLARDVERLGGLVDSNKVVAARLTATQGALDQLNTTAQDFLATLTSALSGDLDTGITRSSGAAALEAMTGIVNSGFNGEHIFAGVNTDVRPLEPYSASPPSTGKAAMDAAFEDFFGFPRSSPDVATINAAQMQSFIETALEPLFLGSGWTSSWSNASDQGIVTRISLTETAETSVSANEIGVRRLAMASAMVGDLLAPPLGDAAVNAVVRKAVDLSTAAVGGIADLQSRTGVTEQRVDAASERLAAQVDLFEIHINDLEGIDPYEASTRVTTLLTQIETSYSLTARIQQLSLIRFLS